MRDVLRRRSSGHGRQEESGGAGIFAGGQGSSRKPAGGRGGQRGEVPP